MFLMQLVNKQGCLPCFSLYTLTFYDEFIDLILYCWLGLILLGLFWFNLGMNYSRSSQEPETITVI